MIEVGVLDWLRRLGVATVHEAMVERDCWIR